MAIAQGRRASCLLRHLRSLSTATLEPSVCLVDASGLLSSEPLSPTLLTDKLGVAPRDQHLFRRVTWCSPPATLDYRRSDGALYLRVEPFRAVLLPDSVTLFDSQRAVVQRAATALAELRTVSSASTFQLEALESLSNAAASHLRGRLRRLSTALEASLADISLSLRKVSGDSGSHAARSGPIRRRPP